MIERIDPHPFTTPCCEVYPALAPFGISFSGQAKHGCNLSS